MLIGAGDSAPLHIGKRAAKLTEMLAGVATIRSLLNGDFPSWQAQGSDGTNAAQLPPPRIIVAASGPRMTELAGEIADGVLLARGFDPRLISMARHHLELGANRSGRSLDHFQVLHYTIVHIENDKEAAVEFGRARARAWIQMTSFRESLDVLGVPETALDSQKSIPNSELDRLCEALYLIGPVEKIRDRIQEIKTPGTINRLICTLSGPEKWSDMTTSLAHKVF